MSTEHAWIPDGSAEWDWEQAIEQSGYDTALATFPAEKTTPLTMADVARVDAYSISYHDERWQPGGDTGTELRLTAVLELTDGRWASLEAWNDYTGWGCQDGSSVRIGPDRGAVVQFGLTDEGRQALDLSTETSETPVAATPPTVELVADLLTEADNDLHDGYDWKLHLCADGNVVRIGIEPFSDDGTRLDEVHFRAVVVEVPAYAVASEPVELPAELARELACCGPDDDPFEGWTVVANEQIGQRRWESVHRLVIRNEQGEHFSDTYRQGLTERQDTGPYEYEDMATFTPVEPAFRVVTEWKAAQAQTGGAS